MAQVACQKVDAGVLTGRQPLLPAGPSPPASAPKTWRPPLPQTVIAAPSGRGPASAPAHHNRVIEYCLVHQSPERPRPRFSSCIS